MPRPRRTSLERGTAGREGHRPPGVPRSWRAPALAQSAGHGPIPEREPLLRAAPSRRRHREYRSHRTQVLDPESPGRALLEPALEQRHLPAGPRTITGHAPILQSSRDRLAVSHDVVVGPEVKGAAHGRAVAFAKQRPDVRGNSNSGA